MTTQSAPTVRAALMTQPGEIEIVELEKPPLPEDGFLLKVDQVGLCGSDKHMYLGHMSVPFPVIFGHEIAGHVTELGPKANESMTIIGGPLREGDPVVVVPSSEPCRRCTICLHVPHRPALCPNRTVHGFLRFAGPEDLRGGCADYMLSRDPSSHYLLQRPGCAGRVGLSPDPIQDRTPLPGKLRAAAGEADHPSAATGGRRAGPEHAGTGRGTEGGGGAVGSISPFAAPLHTFFTR